jgi:hypothetical protein
MTSAFPEADRGARAKALHDAGVAALVESRAEVEQLRR